LSSPIYSSDEPLLPYKVLLANERKAHFTPSLASLL